METLIQAGNSGARVTSVDIRVNKTLRPSRLFKNIPQYIRKSGGTMLAMFVLYRPGRFFLLSSIPFWTFSLLLGMRAIYFVMRDGVMFTIYPIVFHFIGIYNHCNYAQHSCINRGTSQSTAKNIRRTIVSFTQNTVPQRKHQALIKKDKNASCFFTSRIREFLVYATGCGCSLVLKVALSIFINHIGVSFWVAYLLTHIILLFTSFFIITVLHSKKS